MISFNKPKGTVTTNQLGLYNFAIGSAGALSTSGTIAGVKWADGLKYIKVEIDPNNGSAFTLAGTAQLLSVPYALYAGNSSGSAASTILNGNGAPSTTTGKDGDFYIDNVANMIFGPKASGSWPAGKNIVGPKGDKGDAGIDGAKGDTGIKGDKGDKGDAGQGGVTNAGSDIDVSGTGVVADPYIISSKITGANGLTKTGSNIELGGSVTKNTTLAIDAGKTLAITGLTTGTGGENIMVVDGTTGVVKSVANTALVSAENGVTKDAVTGKIELGGALTKATTITSTPANTLAVKGLQTGSTADSVMVVNTSGVLRLINPSSIATAENGVTKDAVTGKIELGGALTKATTITSTPANTLAVKGLQTGSTADSVMVVNTSGVLRLINPSSIATAENGVTKDAVTGKIELGGALTKATTITSTPANTLAVKGLQTGSTADSVMVVNTSGVLRLINPSSIATAENGVTKDAVTGKIELGGALTKATTITSTPANTLAVKGLQTGSTADSVMVVNTSGVLRLINPSSIATAENGVTKDAVTGKIELGGALTKATTITSTPANTLAVKGLQTGSTADSVMVVNTSTGIVSRVAPVAGANGLTKTGDNIELGGSLTKPTTITADNTNTLAITGLQSGNTNDKVVVVDGTTGVVKSVAQTSLVSGVNAVNGVNKDAITGNIELGGALTKATTITSTPANTLAVKGLQTGSTADSVMVVNTSGVLRLINPSSIATAENGVTKDAVTGKIELGGALTKATTITSTPANTLAVKGLQTGSTADSVMVVNTSGVLRLINPSSIATAENGVTKDAVTGKIELGGALTKATTITSTPANTLAVKGLQTGSTADSVMVVNTSGVLRLINPSSIATAENGVTKDAVTGKIELGGALTKATTITSTPANTLAVKGLQTGSTTDSVMVVNPSTGIVSRVAPVAGANGLTKTGNNIELGGSLTKPTTITADNTNTLAITGLQSGNTNDKVVVVDGTTGVVKSVAQTSLVSGVNAVNGVNKDAITGNIELGGALTKATTITSTPANTLAVKGLQTGSTADSVMVVNTSGVLRLINPSSIATAENGVTKDAVTGKIELGGALTKATTITSTPANTLAVKGLQTGSTADSVMVVNTSGVLRLINPSSIATAENGVTKDAVTGKIELGGALTKATKITSTPANTLAVKGLQTGSTADSVMVVNTSGVLRLINPSSIATAENGVTKDAVTGKIELGGALTKATTITSTPANTLAVKGLQTGSTTDSVMVVNPSTGIVSRVAPVAGANGLTKTGNNIELGGSLTKPTTITADNTNTLAITGLQSGNTNDKVVVVDGTTGVVKSVAQTSLVSGVNAVNGVNKDAITGNIELGGALTKATTITSTPANTLAVKGLQTGSTADSVMVVNTSGVLRLINPSSIATAENGVTKDAVTGKIELGGALTKATTITSTPANTLAVKGLQTGSTADSVMVVNTSGVLRLINPSSIATAENGVTKDAVTGKIELGGALTKATTITSTPANTLAVKGLQTGSTADSVMVVNTSGVLRLINPSSIATAENGVTKDAVTGKIELGGALTKATTITSTPANTLAVKGLQTGSTTDSVMVVNPSTGIVSRVAPVAGANGLTKTGNNIELGGSLTKATAIQTTSSNTLALTGLQTGLSTENILVVNGSGVVKSLAPSTANNGITKTGNNFQLGGALTGPTAITTDAAKTLAITGLQTGSGLENIMVVDGSGVVKSLAPSTITANSWSLSGNAATNPATQFLGTTDAQPLVLRTNNVEQMRITTAGNVGIGTTSPNTKLEVNSGTAGTSGFRLTNLTSALTTSTPNAATLGVNATGDLVLMSNAVSSAAKNIINMPSVAIDISTAGTFTLDLYNAYKTQYNTPPVVSAGAPAAIPIVAAATDFYYYVTYYDNNVFTNLSISATGVLTYTVTTNAVSSATFMNIVLVPKN